MQRWEYAQVHFQTGAASFRITYSHQADRVDSPADRFWATIRELGKSKTILLSTHILQEVEAVADRVLFIHAGEIVFDGTPQEMKARGPSLDEVFHQLTGAAQKA